VIRGDRDPEGLVVHRQHRDARGLEGQGQYRGVDRALAQHPIEVLGHVFLDVERHARGALAQGDHELRQDVGSNRVYHAELQRALQLILAGGRDVLHAGSLFEHPLGLGEDLATDVGDDDLAARALEERDTEFVLEMTDRGAQARLADETGRRGAAEMPFPRDRDRVAQFLQGHGAVFRMRLLR